MFDKDLTEINKYNALVDNFNMTTSSRYNNCNNKDSSSKNQISLNINKRGNFNFFKGNNNNFNFSGNHFFSSNNIVNSNIPSLRLAFTILS